MIKEDSIFLLLFAQSVIQNNAGFFCCIWRHCNSRTSSINNVFVNFTPRYCCLSDQIMTNQFVFFTILDELQHHRNSKETLTLFHPSYFELSFIQKQESLLFLLSFDSFNLIFSTKKMTAVFWLVLNIK